MKAVALLAHAVGQVVRHPGAALRVGLVRLTALTAVIGLVVAWLGTVPPAGTGPLLAVLGTIAAGWVLTAWIAVGWHRFVGLGERPAGWLPAWHGQAVLAYALGAFVLGVIVTLAAFAALLVAGTLLGGASPDGAVALRAAGVGVQVAALWAFLRLGTALTAQALGRHLGFGRAWSRTAPASGAILGLAALLVLLGWGADALAAAPSSAVFGAVLSAVLSWATLMLGVAVLTTLHGHLVEERPLA